jgi:hypothetical protein
VVSGEGYEEKNRERKKDKAESKKLLKNVVSASELL